MAITDGVYPTMPVAYDNANRIDDRGIEALLAWYHEQGVDGIFALCQSTEIDCLSFEERFHLGRLVMKTNRNRVRIVISGITAWPLSEQIEEAKRLASLEPDALVFLTNRVAGPEGTCFQKNMEALFRALPESLPLGVYECPRPYKKILSQEDIQFLKESRRVSFIKDTCCDREQIKQRAALTKGSAIRLYNANAATLLDSLRWGYVGYSGVMANFHPRLYSWLIQHKNEPMAETVQDYLAIASLIECRDYPVVCKRYLQRFEKIPMLPFSRVIEDRQPDSVNAELDALYRMTKTVEAALLTDMAQ